MSQAPKEALKRRGRGGASRRGSVTMSQAPKEALKQCGDGEELAWIQVTMSQAPKEALKRFLPGRGRRLPQRDNGSSAEKGIETSSDHFLVILLIGVTMSQAPKEALKLSSMTSSAAPSNQ